MVMRSWVASWQTSRCCPGSTAWRLANGRDLSEDAVGADQVEGAGQAEGTRGCESIGMLPVGILRKSRQRVNVDHSNYVDPLILYNRRPSGMLEVQGLRACWRERNERADPSETTSRRTRSRTAPD